MKKRKILPGLFVACLLTMTVGCEPNASITGGGESSIQRKNKGLVVILPGIEGESSANRNIRKGLREGGVNGEIVIYHWGFPVPGIGMLVNQTDAAGNRRAGERLAKELLQYQKDYPGRPIFLIGHSGGTGVALFALESLRKLGGQPIEGVFLLASSVSASYPLHTALSMTKRGIVNVYNPDDTAMLKSGTGIFGNVDGTRGPSAGLNGFTTRAPKLFQAKIQGKDVGVRGGAHFVATNADLIARYAPPWLRSTTWPPPGVRVR